MYKVLPQDIIRRRADLLLLQTSIIENTVKTDAYYFTLTTKMNIYKYNFLESLSCGYMLALDR